MHTLAKICYMEVLGSHHVTPSSWDLQGPTDQVIALVLIYI